MKIFTKTEALHTKINDFNAYRTLPIKMSFEKIVDFDEIDEEDSIYFIKSTQDIIGLVELKEKGISVF